MLPWHANDVTADDAAAVAAHNNAVDAAWWITSGINVAMLFCVVRLPRVQNVYHNLRYDDSYRCVFPTFCRGLMFLILSYVIYKSQDEDLFWTEWLWFHTLWQLSAVMGMYDTVSATILYNTTYDRNRQRQEDARRDEERWMKRVTCNDARLAMRCRGG